MASLVLGIAGAAIGSMFGPLGTSIGWAIGAGIGSALDQPDQVGPRLTDLKVQNSSYGAPIPIGYGVVRITGNVIWSTDIQEAEHHSGGKGGPETTTFTYSVSFAIGLTQTSFIDGDGILVNRPIVGIRRIWADSRLVYGPGSPGNAYPMTVYYGDEEQLPDPTMEGEEGVGNVPAYRGMSYVVFDTLQLQEFGNRIPNFSFEVICDGAISLDIFSTWPVDYQFPITGDAWSFPFTLNGVDHDDDGHLILNRWRSGEDYGPGSGTGDNHSLYWDTRTYDLYGNLSSSNSSTINLGPLATLISVRGSQNSGIAYARYQASGTNTFLWLKDGAITAAPPTSGLELDITSAPLYWAGNVYACGGGSLNTAPIWLRRYPAPDGSVTATQDEHDISFNLRPYSTAPATSIPFCLSLGADDGYLYCFVDNTLLKLDRDLILQNVWPNVSGLPPAGIESLVIYQGYLIAHYNSGVNHAFDVCFRLYKMERDNTLTFVDEVVEPMSSHGLFYAFDGFVVFRGGILKLSGGGTTLGAIVADVSKQMGYPDEQINVDELTDIVLGYIIANRMSGRSAIDALRPIYQFGAVESNQVVKFRKWTGELDAVVTDDDLGARPVDEDPVQPLEITRVPESELPQEIDVVYINSEMDYQQGNQLRQREVTTSELKTAVSAPVVLTNNDAIRVADVLLMNAWVERVRGKFQLPRKWTYLEPLDVVEVGDHLIRIMNKEEHGYTHLVFDGVAVDPGVFVTAPPGGDPFFVPQPSPVPNPTDLRLLDIPMINDFDFNVGFYAAFAGRMTGAWPGASLYKSSDGGSNYSTITAWATKASIGDATTTLGDFSGGEVFDESNTVTVRITPGSPDLSSSTELGVLNGANYAVLDDEVFQFREATLIGTKLYRLSGLLRGRRGTEQAIDQHAGGDGKFVALDGALNVEGIFAELAQERLYRAVTTGQSLATGITQSFTFQGVSLRPYPLVQLGGGRNGSGDITLEWVPRTRVGGAWVDYVDAPLADPEDYVVNLYSDSLFSNLVAQIETTSRTITVTAAQQTTFFGGLENPLHWGVYHVGLYQPSNESVATT